MEKTKIITGGVLTFALLISLGFNIQPDDTHFCMDRNITYHCDGFSKYYGLSNGKCIKELGENKLCRSGWEDIFREEVENKEVINTNTKRGRCISNQTVCREVKNG